MEEVKYFWILDVLIKTLKIVNTEFVMSNNKFSHSHTISIDFPLQTVPDHFTKMQLQTISCAPAY